MPDEIGDEDQGQAEVPLTGGNVSTVTRIGSTVRRTVGPWTPAVHALLRHLERAGFAYAPRALGMDAQGREVLTYLEGQVFPYPMPDVVWSEKTLLTVARMLRAFHDAQAGFTPPTNAQWRVAPGAPTSGPIICHNDIAPYNTVFAEGLPFGFIDWDFSAPGTALWDIAYAAWFYAPITDDSAVPALDKPHRLRHFCDAYGLRRVNAPSFCRRFAIGSRWRMTRCVCGEPLASPGSRRCGAAGMPKRSCATSPRWSATGRYTRTRLASELVRSPVRDGCAAAS